GDRGGVEGVEDGERVPVQRSGRVPEQQGRRIRLLPPVIARGGRGGLQHFVERADDAVHTRAYGVRCGAGTVVGVAGPRLRLAGGRHACLPGALQVLGPAGEVASRVLFLVHATQRLQDDVGALRERRV